MKYILSLLILFLIAVAAIAQDGKANQRPPVRTTDQAPSPKVSPTIPLKTSGVAPHTAAVTTATVPVRKTDPAGGGATSGGAMTAAGGTVGAGKTGTVAPAGGASPTGAAGKGATAGAAASKTPTTPSALSAKEAADLQKQGDVKKN